MLTQLTFHNIPLTKQPSQNPSGIGGWMGQVLDFVKQQGNEELHALFHNSSSDYPGIHYRINGGNPALAGIGEAAAIAVGNFAQAYVEAYPELGGNIFQQTEYYVPKLNPEPLTYCITHYLFSHGKRKRYSSVKALWGDVDDIERRLDNNIYELVTKQLGLQLPPFDLEVISMEVPKEFHTYKRYGTFFEKGTQLVFKTNLYLPRLGALGTGKSKGYGTMQKKTVSSL